MTDTEEHVVSALLIDRHGCLLLQQRDDRPGLPFAGWWTLFGGAVEDDELPDAAIARELWEELRIETVLAHWKTIVCPVRSKGGHTVFNHVFHGPFEYALENLTLYEGQAMALFSRDEVAGLSLAYAQETLTRDYFTYLDQIRQGAQGHS